MDIIRPIVNNIIDLGLVPTDLSGTVLWLDGKDNNTLFEVSGGVDNFDDKSGLGHNISALGAANRPVLTANAINGHQALVFDGVDDYLRNTSFVSLDETTIFIVSEYLDGDSTQAVLGLSGPLSFNSGIRFTYVPTVPTGSQEVVVRGFSGNDALTKSEALPVLHITEVSIGMGEFQYLLDGVEVGSIPYQTLLDTETDNLHVGGLLPGGGVDGFKLKGPLGEIVIYNRKLIPPEAQKIRNYLSFGWGIALS